MKEKSSPSDEGEIGKKKSVSQVSKMKKVSGIWWVFYNAVKLSSLIGVDIYATVCPVCAFFFLLGIVPPPV